MYVVLFYETTTLCRPKCAQRRIYNNCKKIYYTYNDFGWRQTLSQSTQLPSKMDIVGHKAISVMGLGTSPDPHCDFQQKKLNIIY